jgi:hypothetical protein
MESLKNEAHLPQISLDSKKALTSGEDAVDIRQGKGFKIQIIQNKVLFFFYCCCCYINYGSIKSTLCSEER